MNYIIFNADGSISEKNLAYYIQQGNTGVDTIFVSKADLEDDEGYTCQAFFRLPNGTTNTLAGVWFYGVEYKAGVFAAGWVITLTTNQTTYNGLLQMSISLLLSSSNLLTYPAALVINETGYRPDEDSGVTIEEINSYLVQLQSYQLKYDLANVRGYDTLELATADLPNLADGQIVIVKGDNATFYQVQSGSLVELISDKAYKDGDGLVIKSTYGVSVVLSYDSATDTIISKLYASDGTLLDTHSVALPKATTTENGLMAKEDKVKVDGLATTYETIVNSDAKIKELSGYFTTIGSMLTALNGKATGMYITTRNFTPITRVLILYYNGSSNTGGAIFVYENIVQYYERDTNSVWTLASTFATKEWVNTQLATKQSTSQKGQPNGYASLDSGGKVPTAQLPSYVDDVLEYANLASFPATGANGIIYVALDTNLTYRWSGSAYVEISPSLALGETSSTAYRGDKGKIAYDHSQLTSGNPHNVTKADVGLDNVINPNAYNNVAISTDLDTIAISGIYTCYGTANGVPSADYSWFVLHLNSGVGTTYAKQVAFAYDGKIYVRFKNTTWGAWAFIPASTLGFDNTIKNILTATNLQEAVDELTDDLSSINDKISSSASSSNKVLSASEVVKTMVAPSSTTLTDAQITQIINGVFVQGTFLGCTNPTLFPCVELNGIYYGMIIGQVAGQTYTEFKGYAVDKTTKVVTSSYYAQRITASGAMNIQVGMMQVLGKQFPNFPISTTDSYINKYVNGTWQWGLEAPTPTLVSLNLETILAGTDVNFSCSGSGTSESPYIIMPKENIPHRYNRYQLTANTEPANDIYITIQANGLEKCQVEVTHSVAFTTHHYYVTVLDNNGNARVRISSANTISRAIWDISGTKFIITLDVNGDNVYYATSIA